MDIGKHVRYIQDFPKKGVRFCDMTPLFSDADAFDDCIFDMSEPWFDIVRTIDWIGVFDARGFIFGPAMALMLAVPFFPIRKAGKLPSAALRESYALEYGTAELEIHTDALEAGDRILLVDDLLATGGTALAGIRLVEKLGGIVVGCQFVVEIAALAGRELLSSKVSRIESLLKI